MMPGDYQSILALRIKTKEKERYFAGTLFSKKDPRIVRIDSFAVEIVPEGIMLMIYNNDKPGVIGNLGSFFGKNNINIARMYFGRESAGGMAISVMSIDSPITPGNLEEIKKMPNVLSAKLLNL